MILGHLRMGARQAKNAPLYTCMHEDEEVDEEVDEEDEEEVDEEVVINLRINYIKSRSSYLVHFCPSSAAKALMNL